LELGATVMCVTLPAELACAFLPRLDLGGGRLDDADDAEEADDDDESSDLGCGVSLDLETTPSMLR
jgi:hypothetical protein